MEGEKEEKDLSSGSEPRASGRMVSITKAGIVSRGKCKDSEAGTGLMAVKKDHGEL